MMRNVNDARSHKAITLCITHIVKRKIERHLLLTESVFERNHM